MTDKNKLADKNMGLVHACCKRFSGKGIEYEELFASGCLGLAKAINNFDENCRLRLSSKLLIAFASGCLGLAKAINNFDESRNLQFSTYAFPVIMGEIKRLFRDGGAIRVSRTLKELSLAISRLNNESKLKNGRELTVSELAERLDTSEEKIIDALNSTRVPLSLTAEYDSEGNPQLDVPTDDIQDEISERLSLEQAVKSLCETDRKIIQLRYYRSKTQTQTAKILSMTQVQISRREKKILTVIRDKMSV